MKPTADEEDPLRSQAVDWLMRLHGAPGNRRLQADLAAWLAQDEAHRQAYRSVERAWRLSGELEVEPASPAATVVARLPRPRRARRFAVVAAAALAACIALYLLPALHLRLLADHVTGVAELRKLTLDDGSTVTLDAGSAIAVRYGAARREVALLSGQAFFEVVRAADRPFVVEAGAVTVTVRGTAFAVHTTGGAVSVDVQSGTVEVGVDRGVLPAATLTGGQRLRVDRRDGKVARGEIAADDVAAWREGRLVVDGATIGDVIDELGRYHDGAIVLRDRALAQRRVTGVFDLHRPVEALETMIRTQHGSVLQITPYLLLVSGP